MGLRIMGCVAATALLLSTSLYSEDTRTIYIEVVGKGEFDVIYHRALTNALGAAFGGLVGAGIQSGVESSKDEEKTNLLRPLVNKEAWKEDFLATLNEKLATEGFKAEWVNDEKEIGRGLVLQIYPERYGFRMVDSSTRMVSAFVAFKAAFSSGTGGDEDQQEKESYYITHKNQYAFEQLLDENATVSSDLTAVLEKAAKRLANKIIYKLKE